MSGHVLPPGSTWAISDTANRTVTFATGMLQAATSDNINPLALLCCESFGALLPLCAETRLKIEQLARRNHTSHVLNFIKAQIGYQKGDSVELLSRSDSGLRFLCLAATFCTLDHYDAASRLDAMLQATQMEHQPRPTIKQLQVMMNTLKTKLVLSDYANNVASCEIFIRSALAGHGEEFTFQVAQVPSKISLQDLILAMNQVGRVGETSSIEIKLAPQYAPWTWAFVQWCLGQSPNVRTSTGKSLLGQTESFVTLTIMPRKYTPQSRKRPHEDIDRNITVAIQQPLKNFKEIVFQEDPDSKKWAWQGLVTAATWIRYHFAILFDRFPQIQENEKLKSAIGQAIFFIVYHLPERLILCDDYKILKIGMEKQDGQADHLFHPNTPKPFLDASIRLRIAQDLTHEHIQLINEYRDSEMTLHPSNLAKLLPGACRQCTSKQQNPIVAGVLPCQVNELLELIGTIGSALLTFTLFGPLPETYPMVMAGLTFDTSPFHHRLSPYKRSVAFSSWDWPRLITTGWQALMHEKCSFLSCPPIAIFKYAAKLMGQQKIWDSTIISSKSGQVLFPVFFEALDFMRDGFMQLSAFPGKLCKEGMQFDFFLDSWSDTMHTQGLSGAESEELSSSEEDELLSLAEFDPDDDSAPAQEMELPNVEQGGASESSLRNRHTAGSNQNEVEPSIQQGDVEVEDAPAVEQGADYAPDPTTAMGDTQQTVPRTFSAKKRPRSSTQNGMKWTVTVQDDLLRGEMYKSGDTPVMAWSLLESVARCRLSPPCRHKDHKQAGEVGDEFLLSDPPVTLRGPAEPRTLFNVGRGYADQIAGLETQDYYPATTIHLDGCISCALQLCLDSGSRVVIS